MEGVTYTCKIKLVEPLLGTVPKQKAIYAAYIADKAASMEDAQEEVATVEELEEKGWTGFHRDEEGYFLYDYSVKGFLKEAARTIRQFGPLKQLQDKVNRMVFIKPRRIRLPKLANKPLERPLRAMTAQGPRVALCRSDYVKEGATLTFDIFVMSQSGITKGCLEEILSYGELQGLGQWRSGGHGRFVVLKLEEK